MAEATETPSSVYVARNEVDPEYEYHCDAVCDAATAAFQTVEGVDYPAGERIPLAKADAVVLTGSTAGVYERERRPWIDEQEALVRELVGREIPTLGICFGHQIVNSALGGTVEHVGMQSQFVEASLSDDPLFTGISPVVVALHGDVVVERANDLETIASADHAPVFGTRHRNAPIWTVQFHPEITARHQDRLTDEDTFDWKPGDHSFADVTAPRIFERFSQHVNWSSEQANRDDSLST